MDELKLLIDMVANLPTLAVWVLVGYLVYKVAVVGSVYGVIRLAIIKYHDWKTTPPPAPPAPPPVQMMLGVKPIDETTAAALNAQLARLGGAHSYLHGSDVQKLREALDIVLEPKK